MPDTITSALAPADPCRHMKELRKGLYSGGPCKPQKSPVSEGLLIDSCAAFAAMISRIARVAASRGRLGLAGGPSLCLSSRPKPPKKALSFLALRFYRQSCNNASRLKESCVFETVELLGLRPTFRISPRTCTGLQT